MANTIVIPGDVTFVIPDQWLHSEKHCECENTEPPPIKLNWLTRWNIFTALVHTILASGVSTNSDRHSLQIYLTFFANTDETPLSILQTGPTASGSTLSPHKNDPNELVRIASCWNVTRLDQVGGSAPKTQFDLTNEWVDTGITRKNVIASCVIAFHILSAIFQGIPWFLYWCGIPWIVEYLNCVIGTNGVQAIRYTEYTFSAPLMVVAIGLSFGILDIYTLAGLGSLTAVCMQFGLAADILRDQARDTVAMAAVCVKFVTSNEVRCEIKSIAQQMQQSLKRYMYLFHFVSWLAIFLPWGVIIHVFIDLMFNTHAEACEIPTGRSTTMPDEILFLLFGEAVLFSLFGFVQFVQIAFYFEKRSLKLGTRVEFTFILLSLVAKSSLGLVIFSSSLFT